MALVTGHTGDGKVVERGNAEVIIHVDASTGTARLDGGPTLAPATAQRLLCDAEVQLPLDDRSGNRMHLGRSRRLATDTQIRALKARDGQRCQFPGCPTPATSTPTTSSPGRRAAQPTSTTSS